MCRSCYEEAGSPWVDNERVREAARLAARVYEFDCVGGNLHCMLDDDNIDDEFVAQPFMQHIKESTPEQLKAERACLAAYQALSEAERWSAQAILHGHIDPAPERQDSPDVVFVRPAKTD